MSNGRGRSTSTISCAVHWALEFNCNGLHGRALALQQIAAVEVAVEPDRKAGEEAREQSRQVANCNAPRARLVGIAIRATSQMYTSKYRCGNATGGDGGNGGAQARATTGIAAVAMRVASASTVDSKTDWGVTRANVPVELSLPPAATRGAVGVCQRCR